MNAKGFDGRKRVIPKPLYILTATNYKQLSNVAYSIQ